VATLHKNFRLSASALFLQMEFSEGLSAVPRPVGFVAASRASSLVIEVSEGNPAPI